LIICLNCDHIEEIHDQECRYVRYIEGVGASVCKCHDFKRKKANVKDYARLNQLTLETWYVAPVHRMFGL